MIRMNVIWLFFTCFEWSEWSEWAIVYSNLAIEIANILTEFKDQTNIVDMLTHTQSIFVVYQSE